jgi:hypothetical protein
MAGRRRGARRLRPNEVLPRQKDSARTTSDIDRRAQSIFFDIQSRLRERKFLKALLVRLREKLPFSKVY